MPRFAVREIRSKSIINRVQGMPFNWSINPYRGCRHACVYCYARPTHEYLGLGGGQEFEEVIFAKINAPEQVRVELSRRGWPGETVVIGTATDPYQQAESRYLLTRGILEAFRDFRNPVSITTKSPMVLRDLDLLSELAISAEATVCLTVTTLDERLWRLIEPTTAKPKKRLEAISSLVDRGVRAGVLLSPILPGLTDDEGHLEEVIAAAAGHGAQFVSSNTLRLGPGISEFYLPFIEREFPKLRKAYRDLYRGNYAPGFYTETIQKRVEDLREKHRISGERRPIKPAMAPRDQQLALFQAA